MKVIRVLFIKIVYQSIENSNTIFEKNNWTCISDRTSTGGIHGR